MNRFTLLVAPNLKQADYHAREMGLTKNQWMLVTRPDQVRGYRNVDYKLVGEYWFLDDWREIEQLLKISNCREAVDQKAGNE